MSKFRITAYTGAVIESFFWGRVVIDVGGISAKAKLPILREHERDRIVGVTTGMTRDKTNLYAEGHFSNATNDGRECKALLEENFPFEASVGVYASKVERVAKDESAQVNGATFEGPGMIWRKSEVREISFVSVAADSNTRIDRIAASAATGGTRMKINWVKLAQEFQQGAFSRPINPDRADVVLAQLASELEQEANITFIAAANKVLNDNPELCANYLYP